MSVWDRIKGVFVPKDEVIDTGSSVEDAKRAVKESESILASVRKDGEAATATAGSFRQIMKNNHFGEALQAIYEGRQQR